MAENSTKGPSSFLPPSYRYYRKSRLLLEYVRVCLLFIPCMHGAISAQEQAPCFRKGRHELCTVCPRIYANTFIFMPIYSQLSVLSGEEVARLAPSQSYSPCLLRSQGRGSRRCCAGARWQFGLRAAGPWSGGVGETPGWGIISSLCLPLCLLPGLVLAWSHTRMFCIHLLASTSCPSPRMLKYLSCPAQRTRREEGRQGDASHSPTPLLILPRHPPYQYFVPLSLVNW